MTDWASQLLRAGPAGLAAFLSTAASWERETRTPPRCPRDSDGRADPAGPALRGLQLASRAMVRRWCRRGAPRRDVDRSPRARGAGGDRSARAGPGGDVTLHGSVSTCAILASVGVVLGLPRPALAHAFAQRYDLPVPLGLWVTGAALAVALSFALIGLFVRGTPGLRGSPRVNLLRWRWGRVLVHEYVRWGLQAASVALFLLVVAAGIVGHPNPTRNLAPTMVWILWWVGFAYLSALVGDLWAVVNPWATLFAWAEALYRRGADPDDALALNRPYPLALGVWPAVGLFLAFAWVELISRAAIDPPLLTLAIAAYSLLTWTGMFVFGRAVWLRYGDPFSLAFGVLARFAPTEVRVTDPAGRRRQPPRPRRSWT